MSVRAAASRNFTALNVISGGSISAGSASPLPSNPVVDAAPSLVAVARSYLSVTGAESTPATLVDGADRRTANVRGWYAVNDTTSAPSFTFAGTLAGPKGCS